MPDDFVDEARRKRLAFRELLGRSTMTVMPGGFGPMYARMAEEIGFETFFVAGSQVSGFLYGVPDNGIVGLRDIVDHARHVAAQTKIPIMVDADTGFGNAVNVHYSVQEFVRAGVACINIEDQEAPKKSGTAAGRRLIPVDEAVGKYKAAVAARDEIDPAFAICARCDSLGAEGGGFDDALMRCKAYVTEGGADFVWLNSVETREQIERACAEIPAPVQIIWGGKPPAPTIEEQEKLGVRIALYPTIAASFGMQFAWRMLNDFRQRGTVVLDEFAAWTRESPYGPADRLKLIKAGVIAEIEARCLPESAQRDYDSTWGHAETHNRGLGDGRQK